MKTKKKLLFILISLCLSSVVSAAAPSWIYGETGPSNWTINPTNPNEADTISFSGPTGLHGNSCFARAALGGDPMISVDSTNRIVELWFQGPAPVQCILIWQPISGLQGDFGPLTPGNWTFKCTVSSIAFEIPFTVSGTTTSTTYYVDKDAPGPLHNGASWKWAFTNLQDALDAATAGDTILVAEGIYKPDKGSSVTLGDRTASFQLKNSVSLIGSHAGYGQPNPDARDFEIHATLLSGDLNEDDLWGSKSDNSYHVVSATGCSSCDAILDGFVISGGQADGPIPYNTGGGVYVDGTNPMLINCTISYNNAAFGAGIASTNSSSPYILNCKITDNKAQFFGGALYCYANNINLINCLITGNSASLSEYIGGSAIYNFNGSLTIINCTLTKNIGTNGMAIASFAGNLPASNFFYIYNCILYNGGNEILTNHLNTVSVFNTCIQSGWSGAGTGNIYTNPMFVNSGDYHLQSGSPCIDAGDNSLLPNDEGDLDEDGNTSEPLPLDLDYTTRISNSIVDMGAYEYAGTIPSPDPDWEETDGAEIIFDIPSVPPGYPPISVSGSATLTFLMNFQGILRAEIQPTSAAGGTWNAWFNPDPGVVGPGMVTVTVIITGDNVDIAQLSPGPGQQLAVLKIFVQPI